MPATPGSCEICEKKYANIHNHYKSAKHRIKAGLPLLPPRARSITQQPRPQVNPKRCEHNKTKSNCKTCSAHLFTWCDRCLVAYRTGGAYDKHQQTSVHRTFGLFSLSNPNWDMERFMPPLGPQMPPGMQYRSDVFGIDPATGQLVLVKWA